MGLAESGQNQDFLKGRGDCLQRFLQIYRATNVQVLALRNQTANGSEKIHCAVGM
jgi:hypothetical protein